MKKLSIATVVAVITALLIATAAFAMFSNGNFETGDFTGWIKDATNQNGGILVGPPPSYVPYPIPSVDDMFIVNTAWMNANFGARYYLRPILKRPDLPALRWRKLGRGQLPG